MICPENPALPEWPVIFLMLLMGSCFFNQVINFFAQPLSQLNLALSCFGGKQITWLVEFDLTGHFAQGLMTFPLMFIQQIHFI